MKKNEQNQERWGYWPSPISASDLAKNSLGLGHFSLSGDLLWWQETRPDEGGRTTLMCHNLRTGEQGEQLPAPLSARSRVHEYGGAALIALPDGAVYVDDKTQNLYRIFYGAHKPQALTSSGPETRYGDLSYDSVRRRIVAVRERHDDKAHTHPINDLVSISLEDGSEIVCAEGADFFMHGRISPDGGMIAWLCWCHPHMPWDAASLWIGTLDDTGHVVASQRLAGGATSQGLVSALEPTWSAAGDLYFIDDHDGYWTPQVLKKGTKSPEPIGQHHCDFAKTPFCLGNQGYALLESGDIACSQFREGGWQIGFVSKATGEFKRIENPASIANLSGIHQICVHKDASSGSCAQTLICLGSAPDRPAAIYALSLSEEAVTVVRESADVAALQSSISQAQQVSCLRNSQVGGEVYGQLFLPVSTHDNKGATHQGLATQNQQRPPLLVMCHGGPTAQCDTGFNLKLQFWTSRGFAVLQVDYGGSTGYGRAYRDLLCGKWGELDTQDCIDLTASVVDAGLVSKDQITIMGGSAGGLTVLSALRSSHLFSCGCVRYAVTDLEQLAKITHKFEAHYMESLIGPLPKTKALYEQRSPKMFAQDITAPVLFQQGGKDFVTPPAQSEGMVDAIEKAGGQVTYITWPNEGHGFRSADAISGAIEAELNFIRDTLHL